MAITINGIVCEEIVAGYSEEVALLGGPSARKGFLCAWGDRFKVAVGLLGLASTTSIGGVITLQTPLPHPQLPTTYAHRIDMQPVGSPTQGTAQIQWPKCIVWCNYATLPWSFTPFDSPYNQLDQSHPFVYAEQRMASSCEWMTIPGKAARWATTGKKLIEPATIRLALVDMEITIKQLPYMPTPEVLTSAGLINDATYLGVGVGKLLFQGVTTQQTAVSDGTFVQEGTYRFTARTIRWDFQYDPAQNAFDQVTIAGGTKPLIAAIDFTQIIPAYYQY